MFKFGEWVNTKDARRRRESALLALAALPDVEGVCVQLLGFREINAKTPPARIPNVERAFAPIPESRDRSARALTTSVGEGFALASVLFDRGARAPTKSVGEASALLPVLFDRSARALTTSVGEGCALASVLFDRGARALTTSVGEG